MRMHKITRTSFSHYALTLGFAIYGTSLFSASAEVAKSPKAVGQSMTEHEITKAGDLRDGKDSVKADEQSDSPSDLALGQKIRQSIIKDKSMSREARNLKIVTRDGAVLLKGSVKTLGEKQKIESEAATIAGKDRVTSQIEIDGP